MHDFRQPVLAALTSTLWRWPRLRDPLIAVGALDGHFLAARARNLGRQNWLLAVAYHDICPSTDAKCSQ